MADVKSLRPSRSLLSAAPGVPAKGSASLACVSSGLDKKELSTDAVPSASSSQVREARERIIDTLRTAAIDGLLESSRLVNHYTQGTIGNNYGGVSNAVAGLVYPLNNIALGTSWNNRLGDSVRNVRVRIRVHLRPGNQPDPIDPGTLVDTDANYSYATRVALVVDKMPIIGTPEPYSSNSINSIPPTSFSAIWMMPNWGSATFVGGPACLGIRNPQTLERYHVLREELVNVGSNIPSTGSSETSSATTAVSGYRVHSHYLDWDVDLHGMVTEWYDATNVATQMTNKLYLVFIADANATRPVAVMYNTDLEFVNAD